MKKIIILFGLLFIMVGCGKNSETAILKKFTSRVDSAKSYQLTGKLTIIRNENKYTYDVTSSYKKSDLFKVNLKNTTNDHEQIILKNKEGVYVLTPNLNKSFQFKSDWPYNNSQIYLLQPIVTDLKNDKSKKFKSTKKGYIFTTKVNYINDKNLVKQKIYLDKDANLTKIEVINSNNEKVMIFKIKDIDMNPKFSDNFFKLDKKYLNETKQSNSKKQTKSQEKTKTTSLSEDSVYPMYVPTDTYLSSKDVVKTDDGERVIMTFAGENPFTLVQGVSSKETDYVYGDPYIVLDTVGAVTDESVMWVSNNIEYYVTSDVMDTNELLTVAESINVKAVSK